MSQASVIFKSYIPGDSSVQPELRTIVINLVKPVGGLEEIAFSLRDALLPVI